MAPRKLRLEIQRSVENGDCIDLQPPQWQGHAITTNDITGSVMKILVTDSRGKLISITIDKNGTIHTVNSGNKAKNQPATVPKPTDSKNYQRNSEEKTCPALLNSIRKEVEEYCEEDNDDGSVSFERVLGVISEGYGMENSEEKLENELNPDIEKIHTEARSLAGQFETVYIDSEPIFDSFNDNEMTSRCRLCATRKKDMVLIFGDDATEKNIVEKIDDCLPITVEKTDALPKRVCRLCLEELELCSKFHKTVAEAENQLLILSEQISDKLSDAKSNDRLSMSSNGRGIKRPGEELPFDKKRRSNEPSSIPSSKSPEIPESDNGEEDILDVEKISQSEDIVEIIKCRICGLYFETIESCDSHSEIHSFYNYHPCCICDTIFTSRGESVKHRIQHASSCPHRERLATSVQNSRLNSVKQVTEGVNSDNVISSDKERPVLNGAAATKHKNSVRHTEKNNSINCRICGESFTTTNSSYVHSEIHSSPNNYPCCMCDKSFENETECYLHNLEHKGQSLTYNRKIGHSVPTSITITRIEKPSNSSETTNKKNMVKCRICGKLFGSAKTCFRHSEIHNSEDNFPCCVCNVTFKTEKESFLHRLLHTSRNLCERAMVEEKNKSSPAPKLCGLVNGVEGVTNVTNDLIRCRLCGVYFQTPKTCYMHSKIHATENNHPCSMCDKTFVSEKLAFSHRLEHENANRDARPSTEKNTAHKLRPRAITRNQKLSNMIEEKKDETSAPGIVGDTNRIKCRICGVFFEDAESCFFHSRVHTSRYLYPCSMCDKSFANRPHYSKHNEQHIGRRIVKRRKERFQCDLCEKGFSTERRLKFHKIYHNPKKKPCYCEICDKKMASEYCLFQHVINMHQNTKECTCKVCGKKFRNRASLYGHQGVHTRRTYACCMCKARFFSIDKLNFHKIYSCRVSLGKQNYVCSYCGENFRSNWALANHLKLHVPERPYSCDFCDKTFSTTECRNRHQITHPTEGSIKCELCERRFFDPERLKDHEISAHSKNTTYNCYQCNDSFNSINSRNEHILAVHTMEKEYKCNLCDERFTRLRMMRRHKRLRHGGRN